MKKRATKLSGESAFEVLAKARALEATGRDVVHLEIGQPDFPTPQHVVDAVIEALHDGRTGYGPSPGLPELRESVAKHAGSIRGIDIEAENVLIAPGAKPLLFYGINALAGEGDEVIYPDPGFPMYRSLIAHSGATPVPLPLLEKSGFRFDRDQFLSLVSDKTELLILNSPQNPTGGVLTKDDLRIVADAAKRHDFVVLADEIYKHFCYDAPFSSIAEFDGMLDRTIIVDGFSKSYSMTGWRLGFAILPESLRECFDLYNVNVVSCATTFSQVAAVQALEGPQTPLEEMFKEFKKRRDYLVAALNDVPGVSCQTPGGAFYVFPNITGTGLSSTECADRLLTEGGVAALSGNSFGAQGEGYIRLSYATSLEKLEEGVARLRRFVATLD